MLARATPHQIKMRNEIRTFSELTVFCDFSPSLPERGLSRPCTWLSCLCRLLALCGVCALPKGIRVLLALQYHQSCWSRCPPPAVSAPMFSIPKAGHTLLLPLHQTPPITSQQHKWLIRPSCTSQLAEGTFTAAVCRSQPKQQSQDSDWQGSQRVNILAQLYSVLRYDRAFSFASIFILTFPLLAHLTSPK